MDGDDAADGDGELDSDVDSGEVDEMEEQTLNPFDQALNLEGLEHIHVFESGDGYPVYRIPSFIRTRNNTLLAFAEGRQRQDDKSENDIVLRRSFDLGLTWEPLQMLHEDGQHSLNDPTAVQILEGPHAGRILLMFQRIPFGFEENPMGPGYEGQWINRNYLMYSDDDGASWEGLMEVTRQTRREEAHGASCGPGIAIQKKHEPHKGRIVYPFRQGSPEPSNYSVYSDDGGETWLRGALVDSSEIEGTGNEVQIAELSDGGLLLNARSTEDPKLRRISFSNDGGETWSPYQYEEELIEPRCMCSTFSFGDTQTDDRNRLMFSCPNFKDTRFKGTVYLSYNDGETWSVQKEIWSQIFKYSVITRLGCDTVGVVYENGIFDDFITLARFSVSWLTDGEDRGACK